MAQVAPTSRRFLLTLVASATLLCCPLSCSTVTEDVFDTYTDPETGQSHSVRRFTLLNEAGMKVQLLDYGATIASIYVPDKEGVSLDVALGFANMSGYLSAYGRNPFFGATVGRVANRISNAHFELNDKVYELAKNEKDKHHLHGGDRGFDKRIWDVAIDGESKVTFRRVSPAGEEGYPGTVSAQITFELTAASELKLSYEARTDTATPVSLTNHNYFNLDGHKKGDEGLRHHFVLLNADAYTPVDDELIPTGEIRQVAGSVYDLRTEQNLYELLQAFPPGPNGYDTNFCVNQSQEQEEMNFVGRIRSQLSSINLEVYSDQPGVQFYTSNMLPDPKNNEVPLPGKDDALYYKHGAFCLETQLYPNGINQPNFPSPVLNPGEVYRHATVYKFKHSDVETGGGGCAGGTMLSFYSMLIVMLSLVVCY